MSIKTPLSLLLPLLACGPVAPMTSTAGDTGSSSTDAGGTSTGPGTSSSSATTGTTGAPTTGGDGTSTGPVDSSGTSSTTVSFINPGDFICAAPFGEYEVRCTKECDVWTQDCPDGEKCAPWSGDGDNSWESKKCVPIDPNPGQVGDPCTVEGSGVSGVDSCDLGMMCWNVDEMTMQGTCIGFCTGSPDAPMCPQGTACTIANDGVLILCLPACDPLIQDCADAEVCIPNMGNFICVLDASGEEGQEYDVCEYANACDPGLFCANPENDDSMKCDPQALGCCLALCDLSAPAPQCTSAQTDPNSLVECVAWYEPGMAPPGYEDLGACIIPQ